MIIPEQQAPPAFMERYRRIKRGDEVLDTVAKLKEFWLFAIAQGEPHREMREYIAKLAWDIGCESPIRPLVHRLHGNDPSWLTLAFDDWESTTYIGDSVEVGVTDEMLYDRVWESVKFTVHGIEEKRYNKFTASAAATPFMQRYGRIENGAEKITTVTRLKSLWLFAIAQGEAYPAIRESIASHAISVPMDKLVFNLIYANNELRTAYDAFESYVGIPDENCDMLWRIAKDQVEDIPATKLDKVLAKRRATPQLNREQIKKFLKKREGLGRHHRPRHQ